MLFDFFKKNKGQNVVTHHLFGFQKSFTEVQKTAIMSSLYVIANSDGKFHKKEARFFLQAAEVLEYKLTENFLDRFLLITPEEQIMILNMLDESQKDWFIITIFGMVCSDGKALDIEYKTMQFILESIGITEQRFHNVIDKYEAISRKFNF